MCVQIATRKYMGVGAGVCGLKEEMAVAIELDWRTWVNRDVQIQHSLVHWSVLVAWDGSCIFIKRIVS